MTRPAARPRRRQARTPLRAPDPEPRRDLADGAGRPAAHARGDRAALRDRHRAAPPRARDADAGDGPRRPAAAQSQARVLPGAPPRPRRRGSCRRTATASASSRPTTAATTSISRRARCAAFGTATAIAVRTSETPRGREGHLVEILARGKSTIVGRFRRERGIDWVLEDGDERTDVLIARDENLGAKPGDIVRVEVLEYPNKDKHAVGRVVEIVGRGEDPGIETEVAMIAHGIPHDWPDATLAEARALPREVQESSKRGREDLRDLPLVTIDGETRAISTTPSIAERARKASGCCVAIADVSHYVRPMTPLDREARAARHVGVLSAARDPDAARGAVERALLAQARRRPPVLVCEMAVTAARRGQALALLRRRDALARAAHLRGCGRDARGSVPRGKRAGARPALDASTTSTRRCAARASSAARSTSTPSRRRSCSTSTARSRACARVRAARDAQG